MSSLQTQKHKYAKLPAKLVITNPWEALYVDLIGSYTLKGKDGTEINFMCLTMIHPASSWYEIVELPIITDVVIPMKTKGQKGAQANNNTINNSTVELDVSRDTTCDQLSQGHTQVPDARTSEV